MALPDAGFDATLQLLQDPYRFISDTGRRLRSDVFTTRIGLRRAVCLTSRDGAELFYDAVHFQRRGALPEPVQATLFGRGGVQMLDDEAHRHRKELFRGLLTDDAVHGLATLAERAWPEAAVTWVGRGETELYDEAKRLLCRAACAWAGVPIEERRVGDVARSLALLVEGVLPLGPRHVAARVARSRLESWLGRLVVRVREGTLHVEPGTPLVMIASHRDPDGRPLPARTAAVELLSLLRPTVASAVFVVFVALALHRHPEWRERVARSESEREWFVQEVRRFFRFAPFVAARVRQPFTWQGVAVPHNALALLDLYGIDHDPRIWDRPHRFLPERFEAFVPGPFDLVPQGGGDRWGGHRCPGEPATLELLKVATQFLASRLEYVVPPQDLGIPRSALPGLPRSRFRVSVNRVH